MFPWTPLAVLGKLCLFTLMGFAAVVLSGPLISLATVTLSLLFVGLFLLLPFAFIGLLMWLPYRLMCHYRDKDWSNARRVLDEAGQQAYSLVTAATEVLSGALIGGFLASQLRAEHFNADGAIVVGGVIGALLGLLVASWNHATLAARCPGRES
jgi:hypothetical protein